MPATDEPKPEPCYFPGCASSDVHVEVNTEAQESGAAPMYWVECHWCAAAGPCKTRAAEAVEVHNAVAYEVQRERARQSLSRDNKPIWVAK